jgi:drug/metabolite transporter (DMT)-like permease
VASHAFRDGLGPLVIASVLFGAMAVVVRVATSSMPGSQVAFLRFLGSLIFMLLATRGRGLTTTRAAVAPLLVRGLLGSAAIVLYFVGIRGAGAAVATLLQNTYPVWVAVYGSLLFGRAFSPRLGLALALSLLGVVLVVGVGFEPGSAPTLGALAALASSLLAGGAVIAMHELRRRESAAVITTYFMAVGVVATAPALLAPLPDPTFSLLLALLGVIVTSVVGQWLLHHGLGFTSAIQGSLVAATSVVTASTLESLAFGSLPRSNAFAGAAAMLVAVGLAGRPGDDRRCISAARRMGDGSQPSTGA